MGAFALLEFQLVGEESSKSLVNQGSHAVICDLQTIHITKRVSFAFVVVHSLHHGAFNPLPYFNTFICC